MTHCLSNLIKYAIFNYRIQPLHIKLVSPTHGPKHASGIYDKNYVLLMEIICVKL